MKTACDKCNAKCEVPVEYVGRRVKCKECEGEFVVRRLDSKKGAGSKVVIHNHDSKILPSRGNNFVALALVALIIGFSAAVANENGYALGITFIIFTILISTSEILRNLAAICQRLGESSR